MTSVGKIRIGYCSGPKNAQSAPMDDQVSRERSGRLWVIMMEVRDRLRPVCADLPEDEFEAMVDRIARTQYKYEGQFADTPHSGYAPPPSE